MRLLISHRNQQNPKRYFLIIKSSFRLPPSLSNNQIVARYSSHNLTLFVRQTCEAFENRIIRGVVSKDHVHILVSAPPTLAPSEIMRRIKGRTSSYLFEEFPHLKKRYWGRHFWARGYFCATVGQMTEEMIKEYLEHHFEPNPNDNFKMEPD
jgi:putative transposase